MLRVIRKITLRDVLPVPGIIDKANGPVVEYPKETRRSASMLNIGLSFSIDCGEKNACLRPNKCSEIRGDTGLPGASLFHAMVCIAGALTGLHCLNSRVKAMSLEYFREVSIVVSFNSNLLRRWMVVWPKILVCTKPLQQALII